MYEHINKIVNVSFVDNFTLYIVHERVPVVQDIVNKVVRVRTRLNCVYFMR
jgi:hypothetical protein